MRIFDSDVWVRETAKSVLTECLSLFSERQKSNKKQSYECPPSEKTASTVLPEKEKRERVCVWERDRERVCVLERERESERLFRRHFFFFGAAHGGILSHAKIVVAVKMESSPPCRRWPVRQPARARPRHVTTATGNRTATTAGRHLSPSLSLSGTHTRDGLVFRHLR